MAWCLRWAGVLVASVRNLAFLVLPKHWQAGKTGHSLLRRAGTRCRAWHCTTDRVLEQTAKQGRQGKQGGMDHAMGP